MTRRHNDAAPGLRIGRALAQIALLAVIVLAAACQTKSTKPPQAGEVSYNGEEAANVQEALDRIEAHLSQLDQTVADLSQQVKALNGVRQPVPTGPTDARDVRWRTPEGNTTDVASALNDATAQLEDLATQVNSLQMSVSDLGNSIAALQAHHECPPGAMRLSSELTEGVCMEVEPAQELVADYDAEQACLARGGRLCTNAELVHFGGALDIAFPPDGPDDKPDLGSAEWVLDTQNTQLDVPPFRIIQRLYHSWNVGTTNNPRLDGNPGVKLSYRCCYDR